MTGSLQLAILCSMAVGTLIHVHEELHRNSVAQAVPVGSKLTPLGTSHQERSPHSVLSTSIDWQTLRVVSGGGSFG
ncbi:hypothetical protein F5883DRAFT_535947, partial [Diaporthe sp. PMI_573]